MALVLYAIFVVAIKLTVDAFFKGGGGRYCSGCLFPYLNSCIICIFQLG